MAVGAKIPACSKMILACLRISPAFLSMQVGNPKGRAGTFLPVVFFTLCLACNAAVSNSNLSSYEQTDAYKNAIADNNAISKNNHQHDEHHEVVASKKDAATNDTAVPILSSPLQIAVAANFAKPLRTIANDYFKKSGQEVSVTVSSSGTLFAQLTHGAQFDVFLSADTARPNALIKAGRVNAEDVHVYAKGRLAFLSSHTTASTPHFTAGALAGKKLAIANPKLAPYGNAAKQYLVNTNQWNAVSPHIVMGKNVLQTYQFFTTGNADYALVAYSLALADKRIKEADKRINEADEQNISGRNAYVEVDGAILIPDTLHQPILQSLAVTAAADRKAAASAFARYLLSLDVQGNLPNWGYQPADDSLSVSVTSSINENKRVDNRVTRGIP
ncbi:molybdate ABC transporter substrate-binding protein [uncultured Alteromonas sp.]|jgi:molybdate transport system substrate-binding protein|uniref:molybdate ABC transporter substrate-binding protein n=1 Tax=uncultured Alteromonas sp. TaxID=179113 RepID=UPI0030D91F63